MPEPTSLITGAARVAVAATKIRPWATVRRQDRLIQEEYEDLITWARDDLQREAEAVEAVRADLAGRGMLRSGEYGHQQTRVRDEFARRWRDRKRQSERKLAAIEEAEGSTVKLWRKLAGKPQPVNPDEAELRRITAAWEDDDLRREAVEREVAAVRG